MSQKEKHGPASLVTAEHRRLREDLEREQNWKRWGPYLSERQWGTVREDYSPKGTAWEYFPHDHARSRAYRWGEDGLLGITDRQCRLCFALALWNGRDPILKERLFGLTGNQGNHGEDVKEVYFYLDSTPTHSYMKALYKYPQREFPYAELVRRNAERGRKEKEFELADTGIFDDGRYFDVRAEYAKASPDDILIRIRIDNRGPEPARIDLLPTLWFRNTWSWGSASEDPVTRPLLRMRDPRSILARHGTLGGMELVAEAPGGAGAPQLLFTENVTRVTGLTGGPEEGAFVKDAFHDYLIHGATGSVNPAHTGTKAAFWHRIELGAHAGITLRLRLRPESGRNPEPFGEEFDRIFGQRQREADEFYATVEEPGLTAEERTVARQAFAGLLWNKQFYHYSVYHWLRGDPAQPPPPPQRDHGRNSGWLHLYNRDVISMPDKWEYPWYAAWDLAFHMIPFAEIDPDFAKQQLILLLREWYMHPNGQLPAYEWAFGDVNPPVHAWAAWRVYKMTGRKEQRDVLFLRRVFHKLLLNFTWWVNRKDPDGRHVFSGGFLGLDNIGIFDRSRGLPSGVRLEQADGTAWMAFYCTTMLSIALELACDDPSYEDVASKFFEHFVAIADAMNSFGGTGLWSEEDGFYYDHLRVDGREIPLRLRSIVGIVPLFASQVLEAERIDRLPGFRRRLDWFLEHRSDLARQISYLETIERGGDSYRLLAIPTRDRLFRVFRYLFDEREFLSPHGIRSLSRAYESDPYGIELGGEQYRVSYDPGESTTVLFGGNSNWRGPVWFPLNFLLIEALERYHHFYGDACTVEYPTGSGRRFTLLEIARDLERRLASLFLPGEDGSRPGHGDEERYATDPHWKDLILFHEYFHGDTGRGLGASHQTGWTALVTRCLRHQSMWRASRNSPSG
jgi:hypothetical protein